MNQTASNTKENSIRNGLLNVVRLGPAPTTGKYDWTEILPLAQEQAVIGEALRGVKLLDASSWPERQVLLKWIALTESVRKQNDKVDGVLSQLMNDWETHGMKPIVVKGQVIAQDYEEPKLRQSGDIDVFFSTDDWERVEAWLEDNRISCSVTSAEKHIETVWRGVTVELHHHLNAFSSKRAMNYWQKEVEDQALTRHRTVDIAGTSVRTLGPTDTLTHLLVHAHHHLLTEGIGLRQLLDMAHFTQNHFDELDLNLLHRHIAGIGHERAFNAYMALLNKYLGLPDNNIPFELGPTDYDYADRIMNEVWRGGNFGYKNNLQDVSPGLLHSLNTAMLVAVHSLRFYTLAPAEARSYWWHKIFWRMKRRRA